MKLRIKSVIWNIRKHKTTNQDNKEKTESKKIEDSSLWDNLKQSKFRFIGVPEEEKEQEVGNVFEKIMKENFPNLVKK